MGQKVHPFSLRLGVIRTWTSLWYQDRNYAKWLHEDLKIRGLVKKKLYHAGIAKVEIKRTPNRLDVFIHTSKPGLVIGKKGKGIEVIKKDLEQFVSVRVNIDIVEVRKAETNAQLVAENIATQVERRVNYKRAMKKALTTAMKLGALGCKIECGGRLGGAEMARQEKYKEGRVPLHTLRANIDYGYAVSNTTYGTVGVKVWIFHGEIFKKKGSREMIV
ncbi:MAG: 30S ribosomal protein S3 [Pseudomonadota bacterium]